MACLGYQPQLCITAWGLHPIPEPADDLSRHVQVLPALLRPLGGTGLTGHSCLLLIPPPKFIWGNLPWAAPSRGCPRAGFPWCAYAPSAEGQPTQGIIALLADELF